MSNIVIGRMKTSLWRTVLWR